MIKMIVVVFVLAVNLGAQTQTLPAEIKNYLNNNYRGWKLVKDECYPNQPGQAVVTGDFNGDKKKDYAVKFSRKEKGFIFAFLALNRGYKPFPLHYTDLEDIQTRSLGTLKKGTEFPYGGVNDDDGPSFRLRYDAPEDYRCESDVGGIHYYRNGKFVSY
jgi:hypothetical protein